MGTLRQNSEAITANTLFSGNFPSHWGLQKGSAIYPERRLCPWFCISACISKKNVQEVSDSVPVLWPKNGSVVRAWEGCGCKQIF